MTQKEFVKLMADLWGVDARNIKHPKSLFNNYFYQQELALRLVKENKVTDFHKRDCTWTRYAKSELK